jgi:hypothetical protein
MIGRESTLLIYQLVVLENAAYCNRQANRTSASSEDDINPAIGEVVIGVKKTMSRRLSRSHLLGSLLTLPKEFKISYQSIEPPFAM